MKPRVRTIRFFIFFILVINIESHPRHERTGKHSNNNKLLTDYSDDVVSCFHCSSSFFICYILYYTHALFSSFPYSQCTFYFMTVFFDFINIINLLKRWDVFLRYKLNAVGRLLTWYLGVHGHEPTFCIFLGRSSQNLHF